MPIPPKEELERLYVQDGLTMLQIGVIYDRSATLVSRWLVKHDIHRDNEGRQRPPKDELEQHLIACGGVPQKKQLYGKVGAIYGCSAPVVAGWLRGHGLNVDNYIFPPISKKETLTRLFVDESMSIPDIATMYMCSTATVVKWLREHGLQPPAATTTLPPTRRNPPNASEHALRRHLQSRDGMWSAKKIYAEIAIIYKCTPHVIRGWVEFYGIRRDFRPYPPTKETLEHLYVRKGMSITQIMGYYDLPGSHWQQDIQSLLNEYGITLKRGAPSKTACQILRDHKAGLADDPDRLSTEFMLELIGVECNG